MKRNYRIQSRTRLKVNVILQLRSKQFQNMGYLLSHVHPELVELVVYFQRLVEQEERLVVD